MILYLNLYIWISGKRLTVGCVLQTLKRGVEAGADSAAGWKALAELQYQNREWQDCFQTSVKGLEWSQRRRYCSWNFYSGQGACSISGGLRPPRPVSYHCQDRVAGLLPD